MWAPSSAGVSGMRVAVRVTVTSSSKRISFMLTINTEARLALS